MTIRSILLTILNILSTIVGLTIGLSCLLKLIGANQAAPLVVWINIISNIFLYPFRGIFQDIFLSNNSRIDLTAILGLFIYAILFSVIYKIVYSFTTPVVETDYPSVHSHI